MAVTLEARTTYYVYREVLPSGFRFSLEVAPPAAGSWQATARALRALADRIEHDAPA